MSLRLRLICFLSPSLVFFAPTGHAQALAPDQASISLTAQPGAYFQSQTIHINSSGAALGPLQIGATTLTGGNWLSASPSSASGTPATIIVSPGSQETALTTGVYLGSINVTATGATNSPLSIPVTLTVGTPTSTTLTVTPASITFTAQAGGASPAPVTLNVGANQSGVSFAASASTTDAYNWLQVSAPNAIAPTSLTVMANTAGMPAGNFTGTVTLTPSSGGTLAIAVSLNLTSGTSLSASVSSLQFYYQAGSFLPADQMFSLSTGNTPLGFSLTASTTDGFGWLQPLTSFGTTPQTITVHVAANQLNVGVYHGTINVSVPGAANSSLNIPVTLTISTSALLTVGASPGRFIYQVNSTAPAPQTVPIGSTSGSLNFTVTTATSDGSNWLAVSPLSGTTPQNLTISVVPGALAAGNYTGTVTVSALGAANSPATIPVNLTVSSTAGLLVSAQSVTLNFQIGGVNQVQSQPVYVTSTGNAVTFNATVSTGSCGGNWLEVFPATGTTPYTLNVGYQQIGLTSPEVCNGAVVLTPAGSSSSTQVGVTLNVAATAQFNVSPQALSFSAPYGGDLTNPQTVNLSTTDNSAVSFTTSVSTNNPGTNWLLVNTGKGSTPASLSVTANPYGLNVGTYAGTITVSTNLGTQAIPVSLQITSSANLVVAPTSLSFTQVAGGSAPAPQNITITSTAGTLNYAISTSTSNLGQWLSAIPVTGSTPGSIAVSVSGGNLAPNTYTGSVTLSVPGAGNSPFTVPVTLTVTGSSPQQSISPLATFLSFSYRVGSAGPSTQQLSVTSTAGTTTVSATVTAGANWLTVTPASQATPATFTVSVSPAGLAAGGYDGTITLTAAGSGANPVTVTVHLDVAAGSSTPTINAVTNAASGAGGVISPGEIVTLSGTAMGPPAPGVGLTQLTSSGMVDTTLGGTQVFFDEFPAPMLYASASQVNAIVPYEIQNRTTVQVTVVSTLNGAQVTSPNFGIQTAATVPGIFTVTQNGQGQGAILNQDNSYNGAATPAAKGSIVQVFATGEGVENPALATGSVTSGSHAPVAHPVTAIVNGAPATVTFAGAAPGAVAGLFQVNVRIPMGAPSGNVPLTISVGGALSQTSVTVAVQ